MYFQDSYSGLPSKFETFRKNIELTDSQRTKIQSSHIHLREKILQPLNYVSHTFLTGSYKKKTLIKPANDIDAFVVLSGYDQYDITPNSILNKLKNDLQSSYPNSKIKQNKPCVVIEFNHITFELTPAIEIESFWGHDSEFYIPNMNSSNEWQKIENPRILEKSLTSANKSLNNKLNPLIKMMKKCKQYNNLDNVMSFEMEKMAIDQLYSINGYRDGVEKLLRIYDWTDNRYSQYDIESMTDDDFAYYCRNTLFGNDFPS